MHLSRTLLSFYSVLMESANKLILILFFHLLILNVASAFPVRYDFFFLDILEQKDQM